MEKKLKVHFSKQLQADIWEQNLSNDQLLLTTRDSEKMEVAFHLMNLIDGDFIFEGLSFEENWWVSVYHFFDDTIVFQVYEDTQDIETKSYFALNVNSQEAIWSLDEVTTMGRRGYFLQMRGLTDEAVPFWLDIRNGEVFDKSSEEFTSLDIPNTEMSPLHYIEEGPHFATIQTFLNDHFGIQAVSACDYLEYKGHAYIAYHKKATDGLEHFVLVLTTEGDMVLHEKRDEALKGLISGAFFIAGEQLIFVEGRKTLKSYLIV